MNTDELKNKTAGAMEDVKQKVNKFVADNRVQNVKATITKFLSDVKSWVVLNWKSPGWQGKFKVVCACIIAFFFCRGLFCGWGTSRLEKALIAQKKRQLESDAAHAEALRDAKNDKELREAEAAARLFGAMFGGGGSSSEKDLYMCRHCGNQVRSSQWPGIFKCSARGGNNSCDWKLVR